MFFDTKSLSDGEIFLKLVRTAEENKEKNWVPAYYFSVCLPDGTVAGTCDLRVGHNENTYYGGNIGYEILPQYRGHHYAAKACRLLLQLAQKHGLKELIITCEPGNTASRKTCERAGGKLETIAELPKDNDLYEMGERSVCVYHFFCSKPL